MDDYHTRDPFMRCAGICLKVFIEKAGILFDAKADQVEYSVISASRVLPERRVTRFHSARSCQVFERPMI